jgi:hypothetical protein
MFLGLWLGWVHLVQLCTSACLLSAELNNKTLHFTAARGLSVLHIIPVVAAAGCIDDLPEPLQQLVFALAGAEPLACGLPQTYSIMQSWL